MADFETIPAIAQAIRARQVSAVEICRQAFARISRLDRRIGAFLTLAEESAMAQAAALDARPGDWDRLPLLGVPIAIKDNICTRALRTTAGSRMLETYVPPYDATVVTRLLDAGAVIVGKTNCDEFAMGSSTENSAFQPTRNPWGEDLAPGGSSGGSAAAVAARMVPLALGSDTGGSIRQPAALCGVVGVKPTYGRVSRFGLIAFASSLDTIGPLTTTTADAAAALQVLAGPDPRDATCAADAPASFSQALDRGVNGLRLGVPRRVLSSGVDEDVRDACTRAIAALEAAGAHVVEIDLPHEEHGVAVYYLIATAEASSNLSRYDGVRYGFRAADADTLTTMYEATRDHGFGAEVKRRILLGTYVLSAGYYEAYYRKAQQVRTLIRRDYETAFERVDAIAMPTSPTAAFPLGERVADPLRMYLSDVFTVGISLAGLPAVSVPCGLTRAGLPVGLQIAAPPFGEPTMFQVAAACERLTPASEFRPRLG